MAKDSQIDNKFTRMMKATGGPTIATENQNKNKNAKRHSVKNNDV
ncbi:MAG: hypothetical protein SPJ62_14515 [Inconstantimicrobium porci]|nr:hypothetical protein [Inconstantimicrobium porci]MDD6770445.1 hypothetical protein [Inconstantimicrobium porci]MDY5913182.1 hypothetical protein [Inconstantimicrobium porci]